MFKMKFEAQQKTVLIILLIILVIVVAVLFGKVVKAQETEVEILSDQELAPPTIISITNEDTGTVFIIHHEGEDPEIVGGSNDSE